MSGDAQESPKTTDHCAVTGNMGNKMPTAGIP